MRARQINRRLIATAAILLGLLWGTQLLAAVTEPPSSVERGLRAVASGALSQTNSKDGMAIFTIDNLAPGDSTHGSVTITSTGELAGVLKLSPSNLSDAPGPNGGRLSEALDLEVTEEGSGSASEVYSGKLATMPGLELGTLAAGEERSYRFEAGFPASASVTGTPGANLYQGSAASINYDWTLTAADDAAEPGDRPCRVHLLGDQHSNRIRGSAEDEAIFGSNGEDRIRGKAGRDCLDGGPGKDRLRGGGGDDLLRGGRGADRARGGGGDDRLRGDEGPDQLWGGQGSDDILAHGAGRDWIDCGSGDDSAYIGKGDRTENCEQIHLSEARIAPNG